MCIDGVQNFFHIATFNVFYQSFFNILHVSRFCGARFLQQEKVTKHMGIVRINQKLRFFRESTVVRKPYLSNFVSLQTTLSTGNYSLEWLCRPKEGKTMLYMCLYRFNGFNGLYYFCLRIECVKTEKSISRTRANIQVTKWRTTRKCISNKS